MDRIRDVLREHKQVCLGEGITRVAGGGGGGGSGKATHRVQRDCHTRPCGIGTAQGYRYASKASCWMPCEVVRLRRCALTPTQTVREVWDELDTDKDGCLNHLEVIRLVRRFLPGA